MKIYLTSGRNYYYSIRSVDANGNVSGLTAPRQAYASWRTSGRWERIEKIYISKSCWNWCCGLFDGKIELQYKISVYDDNTNSAIGYPSSGVDNLPRKKRRHQKGKWCNYYSSLFPWDLSRHSYDYRFKLIEDDGSGNQHTITFGNSFKESIPEYGNVTSNNSVSFKRANSDEEFGEVLVQYWTGRNSQINLKPLRGSASMILYQ